MAVVIKQNVPSYLAFLNILRVGGFFPCQKVICDETGTYCIEPTKAKIQVLRYVVSTSILLASIAFAITLIYDDQYDTMFEFYIELHRIGASLTHSNFDFAVFMTLFAFIFVINITIQLKMHQSKNDFCSVHNYFKANSRINPKFMLFVKKGFNYHLAKIATLSLGFPTFIIGFTLSAIKALNSNLLSFCPYIASWFLLIAWCFAPMVAFHMYFLEVALLLNGWILTLKDTLLNSHEPQSYFTECKVLLKGMNMFVNAISKTSFWLFNIMLILSIIEAYLIVAFFLSQDVISLAIVLTMIGYGVFGMLFLFLVHQYCNFSQVIKDFAEDIGNTIMDIQTSTNDVSVIDGKSMKMKHVKKRIAKGFQEFQGFHGDGYYTLGKSLLTSIVANFVTYLIILIQFKVSEMSSTPQ